MPGSTSLIDISDLVAVLATLCKELCFGRHSAVVAIRSVRSAQMAAESLIAAALDNFLLLFLLEHRNFRKFTSFGHEFLCWREILLLGFKIRTPDAVFAGKALLLENELVSKKPPNFEKLAER